MAGAWAWVTRAIGQVTVADGSENAARGLHGCSTRSGHRRARHADAGYEMLCDCREKGIHIPMLAP